MRTFEKGKWERAVRDKKFSGLLQILFLWFNKLNESQTEKSNAK